MLSKRTLMVRTVVLLFFLASIGTYSARDHVLAAETDSNALQEAFANAAHEFGVPERVLLAVSYHLSRWENHAGAPSTSGGYGPMHLIDINHLAMHDAKGTGRERSVETKAHAANRPTLQAAATVLGLSTDILKRGSEQNIRGGAALLAQYARTADNRLPEKEADWYGAVVRYGGDPASSSAQLFAEDVYATLGEGASRMTSSGQQVTLAASTIAPNRAMAAAPRVETSNTADCPPELACRFAPAAYKLNNPDDLENYGNYDLANREADGLDIRYIVIHDTETPYYDTIRYFQNSKAYASSHYVLRSSDGEVTQMVHNRDVAWTAGNWYINAHAINLEHEGYAMKGASWFSEQMYRASARLTRYLALKYGVPLDRAHIIGHDEVPGISPTTQVQQHWDPGPFWDWAHYMDLVGAPITGQGTGSNQIVTIKPNFATNRQSFSDTTTQPANMLYLRTAPNASAALLDDPAVSGSGTRSASDWGNKAVTGQQFYRFARQGDWDGIYYAGQHAWFYNPGSAYTLPGSNMLIRPKAGRSSIPVYGGAYPEESAYVADRRPRSFQALQYTMPAGQIYVAYALVDPTYYSAPTFTSTYNDNLVVRGKDSFYVISFNHRLAFVRATDVDLVTSARPPMPHLFYVPGVRRP